MFKNNTQVRQNKQDKQRPLTFSKVSVDLQFKYSV